MPEGTPDSVSLLKSQVSTQETTTSVSPSDTIALSSYSSPSPQVQQSPHKSVNGGVSPTLLNQNNSLPSWETRPDYSTITSSSKLNIPSSSVPAVSHSPDILDQFYLYACPGQEFSQPEMVNLAQTIPTSHSCQTVNPSYLDGSLTETTLTSSHRTPSYRDQLRLPLFPSTSKTASQGVLQFPKEIITSPPFRSIPQPEGTTPSGEDAFSNADPLSPHRERVRSTSPSLLNSQCSSREGDGYQIPSSPTRAIYWAVTSWEDTIQGDTIIMLLKQMKHLKGAVGSAIHQCASVTNPHRHWLLRMSQQIRPTAFPLLIRQNCWLAPVTPSGEDTLKEAIAKYLNYIKGKGLGHIEMGEPIVPLQVKKNRRTKNEEILDLVLAGERPSRICQKYPQLMSNIYKLARFRPQRTCRTDLVYYYGPPGTGKTSSISRVLNTVHKC